jgi:hypothetical protein
MPRILSSVTDFEAYNKNTQEQYEALGRFVVAFEAMVNEVRDCSINLLLTEDEVSALVDIAFHHPVLTAKPLFEIFRALIVEFLNLPDITITTKDRDTFQGVLKTIATEYFELTNIRNTLLHGTWYIGYSTPDDPNAETFSLRKFKPTSSGLEKEDAPTRAFNLLALKDRCEDVRYWITFVHACIPRPNHAHDLIGDRFIFKDGKWRFSLGTDVEPEPLPRISQ